ncbi:WG repeat-containing protein [uncultured Psychrobacter sp.]|uniref:WG repeat-containing protein n=1 Tax=uncultured Psychrobacter sp. TaxID=259303 RepID=UPI0034586827
MTTTPEVNTNLVHYTVPGGGYSEYCSLKDEAGKIILKAEYNFCGRFDEGMAYLLKNGPNTDSEGVYMIGCVNIKDKLVIPVYIAADYGWFLDARDFSDELVAVLKKR